MTNPVNVPEPIDYKAARVATQELCRALGWSPNDVTNIEVTAAFIRVHTRGRQQYTMTTQGLTTTAWTPKSASYGHAANIV